MRTRFVVAASALALFITTAAVGQTNSKAAGHWEGKIQMPQKELPFTVDLAKNDKGGWIGSISITGTTAVNVPLTTVSVEDTAVKFTADLPDRASFEGKLSADGNGISGTASNEQGGAPFELTRSGEANVKAPTPSSPLPPEFAGDWAGTLDLGGKTLRVVLKMTPAADGTATASLISVDQGNQQIPVTTVTIKDKDLQLEARAISGAYKGTLRANGEIAGEWTQRTTHVPLTFKRASAPKNATPK